MKINKKKYSILIDDEDFERINQYIWSAYKMKNKNYYQCTTKIKQKTVILGRFILGLENKDKCEVDHINGNPLDNRKCNLRIVNRQQNNWNTKISKNNKSGYKGVIYFKYGKRKKRWLAKIYKEKSIHLGYFKTAIDAAKAYNKAVIKYFGEFAKLNDI